jgi:hypothetical protein
MTPEWVAAIAGVAAAATALIALVITLALYGKQSKSLEVTIKALNDEMARRREERERERRAPAEAVRIFLGESRDNSEIIRQKMEPYGQTKDWLLFRAHVVNTGASSSTNVSAVSDEVHPSCCVVDGEDRVREEHAPAISPGQSASFYWIPTGDPVDLEVHFTDEAGVRWRLHRRDGLSEVTGPA